MFGNQEIAILKKKRQHIFDCMSELAVCHECTNKLIKWNMILFDHLDLNRLYVAVKL